MKNILIICSLILFGLNNNVYSQQVSNICLQPEFAQFDFWVGSWNLEWTDAKGNLLTGHNNINKILNSCVIEENFTGAKGPNQFLGKSVSVYNFRLGKWQQTWVDNSGAYLEFIGGMENDKMILSRSTTTKDGNTILQRMIFYNITPISLDWNWESSKDNGETWVVNWHIKYLRD